MTSNDDAVARFFSNWAMYRAVIDNDCMDHRQIYSNVSEILRERDQPFTLVDLGCGDAAGIAPALNDTAITRFVGVDNAEPALDFAQETFSGAPYDVELLAEDLTAAIRTDRTFDVVVMAFALHHFQPEAKRAILHDIAGRLNAGGELLLIDLVRQPGQSRAEYLSCYLEYVHSWPLDEQVIAAICDHVTGFDFPEEVATQPHWALEGGFSAVDEFYLGAADLRGNPTQRGWRMRV